MKQPWSHSRLKDFELCPLQCYYKNYAPKADRIKFVQNKYTLRGSKLHKQLEIAVGRYQRSQDIYWQDLDPVVVQTLSLIKPLLAKATAIFPEKQLAFSDAWTPSDWYDTSGGTWLRVVMDLVLIFGSTSTEGVTTAFIPDYKTGKIREDNVDQLEITALAAFRYFPAIDEITAAFLWMDHKKKTVRKYRRDQADELEHKYRERAGLIDLVAQSGDWRAKPNYLCKKYCQVGRTRCGHCGG